LTAESFSFPVQLRLRTPADYQQVFAKPAKSSDRYFTVLATRNTLSGPRLGLAIAKKNIRKAVARNRIKRVARESFRLRQYHLSNLDFVVLARRDAANAAPEVLAKSLERHWLKLLKRCESQN
jgi:ribonuclease P protein component